MNPTLTPDELAAITGGMVQPKRQLDELLARGFWRARLVRGKIVLERAHYEAVCGGAVAPGRAPVDNARPRVKPHAPPRSPVSAPA